MLVYMMSDDLQVLPRSHGEMRTILTNRHGAPAEVGNKDQHQAADGDLVCQAYRLLSELRRLGE